MLPYTSLITEIYNILVYLLKRFQSFNYYDVWQITSLNLSDQLLKFTLIKLNLNYRDLNLADRFNVSRRTVSNIVKTLITALHKILFLGIMNEGMPSQMKC